MIPFNRPLHLGNEIAYIKKAVTVNHKIGGDGPFTKACTDWLCENASVPGAFLTSSGTHSLEMSALLCEINPGDEVIMSAFTFVSTANAFVLRGAKIVYVDIRPDTMNIDEKRIETAITKKTKAIVPMHYAGIGCEMDTIIEIAQKYNLIVIEDAAQGVMATYKGKALGSIGDMGCYSFHETKNYTMGEGGALLVKRDDLLDRAGSIRDKGTNRQAFLDGKVDFYSWVDLGSSYLPSEINAAYLLAQLEEAEKVRKRRLFLWNTYYNSLKSLEQAEYLRLPVVPEECQHNGHLFYIKVRNIEVREKLIQWLSENDIIAVFHYTPLHNTVAGKKFGRFHGKDQYTTKESSCLLRLPLYYSLTEIELNRVIEKIKEFFNKKD